MKIHTDKCERHYGIPQRGMDIVCKTILISDTGYTTAVGDDGKKGIKIFLILIIRLKVIG